VGRQELARGARRAHDDELNQAFKAALAASVLAILFSPVGAAAAASPVPTPSPGLDQVLASAPAGFTINTAATMRGRITAEDFAATYGSPVSEIAAADLKGAGFIDGFAGNWLDSSASQAITEVAMAFPGAQAAHQWEVELQLLEAGYASYKHSDPLDGVPIYFGAHFDDTTNAVFSDEFAFPKGNDVFFVIALGKHDDVLQLATMQAMQQYQTAPPYTIPPARWPENIKTAGSSGSPALLAKLAFGGGGLLAGLLLASLVFLIVVLVRRPPATAATAPVTVQPGQMSADRSHWWDGQTWRDAQVEAPPSAQRSADGRYWWDGTTWRPAPPPKS